MNFTDLVPVRSRPLAAADAAAPARPVWHRPSEVPATDIPLSQERKRGGTIVSVVVHGLLLLLFLQSAALHTDPNLKPIEQGAGGPGPVGGGGGGNRGTGGVEYIQLAPPPKPVEPPVTPVVAPPKPPEEVVLPPLEMPKVAQETKVDVKVQTPVVGIGGGSGTDGTKGNGPGAGGGIGSGIGTGNGSAVGPGTGGGNTGIHAPTMTEMLIPPLPTPAGLKGLKLLVIFDVDSTGKVLSFVFTPTKDGGYNKRLEEVFRAYKFRPGTTMQGVPVRAKVQIEMTL